MLQGQINALRAQLGLEADDNLSDSITALQTQIANLQKQIKDAEDAEDAAEAEAKLKAMAAAGKALHGALGATPLSNLHAATLGTTGLVVSTDASETNDNVTLKAGASAGSLGAWNGMHYAHTNAGTKVSNAAVVYTNRGAPTTKSFASEYGAGNPSAADGTYNADNRSLALAANILTEKAKSSMFPTVGSQNYPPSVSGGTEASFSGMYDGASGTYLCTTANNSNGCAATVDPAGGGIMLTGTWIFTHAANAMVSRADPNYLYFGWWLTKDAAGKPTSASAFTDVAGSIEALATNPAAIGGSATYSGHAAGKFAINNPLGGSDAGHFTADATLAATFGTGPTAGLSGTLDNFMANEQAVPWSVKLNRAEWDATTNGMTTAHTDVDTTDTVDESRATVWSIDGNAAPASGIWGARMYDEKPGGPPAGDNSNVPTSVTGTFQSMFGSTHTMVGAFGATKD